MDETRPKKRGMGRLIFLAGFALLLAVFVSRSGKSGRGNISAGTLDRVQQARRESPNTSPSSRRFGPKGEQTAELVVAGMVNQFGRSRRELARAMGRKSGKAVPEYVEKFFDAIEAGKWEEIEKQWKILAKHSGQYDDSEGVWEEMNPFWNSILDAYGVAEQAHLWPADKLLDYGNSILDSLRPGMAYVGGTDPGRWIPELINEANGSEARVILTQNAFADSRYIDFMEAQYGDRMATLTQEDSKAVFEEYKADVLKRLEHDKQFPNDPKQVKPGENVKMVDGKLELSGQTAVMQVNERLFNLLMKKNPEMKFGIEHSFPFDTTSANSAMLGPIIEVGASEENALTQERAGEAVDYWRKKSEEMAGPDGLQDEKLRLAYAKLAANQGYLLKERGFQHDAEQSYRLAVEMAPSSSEAVFSYVNLLVGRGAVGAAIPVVEKAISIDPKKEQFRGLLEQLKSMK